MERRDPAQSEDEDEDEDDEMDGAEDMAHSNDDTSDTAVYESEDSEDIEEDPELRRKIEVALQINGIQAATDDEASDSSTTSSDDEVMDDDQMMQLDAHLAEIFRSRAKGKGHGGL